MGMNGVGDALNLRSPGRRHRDSVLRSAPAHKILPEDHPAKRWKSRQTKPLPCRAIGHAGQHGEFLDVQRLIQATFFQNVIQPDFTELLVLRHNERINGSVCGDHPSFRASTGIAICRLCRWRTEIGNKGFVPDWPLPATNPLKAPNGAFETRPREKRRLRKMK